MRALYDSKSKLDEVLRTLIHGSGLTLAIRNVMCLYFVQLRIAKVKPLPCIKVRSTSASLLFESYKALIFHLLFFQQVIYQTWRTNST